MMTTCRVLSCFGQYARNTLAGAGLGGLIAWAENDDNVPVNVLGLAILTFGCAACAGTFIINCYKWLNDKQMGDFNSEDSREYIRAEDTGDIIHHNDNLGDMSPSIVDEELPGISYSPPRTDDHSNKAPAEEEVSHNRPRR